MAITTIDLSSLDGNNGFHLDGIEAGDDLGGSASNAGDVNSDGFDDVVIGAFRADPNGDSSGSSYVVFGKAVGFDATMDLSTLNGTNGFRLDGEAILDSDGAYAIHMNSISNAGDINGDGFDDVLVGAHLRDFTSAIYPFDAGYSYVVFGKSSGFSPAMDLSSLDGSNGFHLAQFRSDGSNVSSAGDINGDGFDDLILGAPTSFTVGGVDASYIVFGKAGGFSAQMDASSLDGTNGFRLIGGETYSDLGTSVSSAGDINGDGFDDVIIGAPGADPNGNSSGSSYVVFGKSEGFDTTLDLSNLDGSNGFRLDGVAANDRTGFSVSNAGDVNGDGFDDLIIGASNADPNGESSGSSYVVFGKASGFAAALDLSSLDGNNGFRLDGVAANDASGGSVSNAGDVNGDGFDDLIVGTYGADPNGDQSGSSYVVFGKGSGFSAAINLSSLDSNSGVRLDGVAADDRSGTSVSGAEDLNGDGFDDLIVGAPGADPNGDQSGSSYVVFGSSQFEGTVTFLGTGGDDTFTGTTVAERFEGGDGNDTLIGGGGADVFQGGNGDDVIRVPELDFQILDGDAGIDTMELTGGGINLNLANFHDTIIGIETIDLTGSGDNTLTFTLPDLFSLSETTQIFTVNGDAGDRVTGIGTGWADGGIDGNYHIYSNRGTVVRVNVAVSADPPPAGVVSLSSLSGNNGFRLDGVTAGDFLGRSVSSAGDVNGDGFDDVIVGSNSASPNDIFAAGSSYVVFGKAPGFDATLDLSSLDGSNGFRLDGVADRDNSGYSVSSAGDVNGDGFDDVIVGAPGAGGVPGFFGSAGASYVVFGKASGFDATLNLSSIDGSNGFRLDGVAVDDQSGRSVSNAGDINGDGFDDVIVGVPKATPNDYASGSSYVVFGKASGFNATMDLSSLDGNNGFRLDGGAEFDRFGKSVSNAGDVNGDGFDDLIVGAYGTNPNGDYSGASYVVFGKAAGFDATLDLSNLDGNNGFRLDGAGEFDTSGRSVSNAGDVNGDGFDDVIIGANGAYQNGDYSGASYVVFGKATGFDAAMNLSNLDGSNGFRLDGVAPYDSSNVSVSNAGDFNGDGFDDLIVGSAAGTDLAGVRYSDASYVVYGKASGFGATLSLSNLDGSNGFRLDGIEGGGRFVPLTSVSSAGDVNGDGFDDLIVGDPDAPSKGEYSYSGSSYVIFGRSNFGSGNVIEGTSGDDNLTGTSAAEIFEAGAGNDSMIGRGGADVFHGDAGDDNIRVSDLSFQLVDGGSGNDALHLAGSNLNLDLANFDGKISGIESICIYGRGDNTLTLTAADLLNLSDTTNTLKVHGNAGDHIVGLSSGWTDGGIRPNGYFHTYTQGDAVLLVGLNLTTDFV